MAEITSTRLRYVAARQPAVLSLLIDRLPFKVEIKGGPQLSGEKWFVWFVIPDIVPEFQNFEEP